MALLIWFIITPVLALTIAIYTNFVRKQRSPKYKLIPNCLLTRWPVLFVTGRRSVFYFAKYWNIYPEFLTEHGYEVYTLTLPWSKSADRLETFREFIHENISAGRRYHLVVDSPTRAEFAEFLTEKPTCVISITEWKDSRVSMSSLGFFNGLSYQLHRLKSFPHKVASPHCLGVSRLASLKNAKLLLHRANQLAEEDFQADV